MLYQLSYLPRMDVIVSEGGLISSWGVETGVGLLLESSGGRSTKGGLGRRLL
jgi:hypothetical protein